jgi:ketosteroid isomerase-like protein
MVRRVLSLAAVAVVLAAPGFAQQITEAQKDVRQQVEAYTAKWTEAYNSGNAKAVLAMSVPDAFGIDPSGLLSGAQKVEGRIENNAKMGIKFTAMTVDEIRQVGKDAVVAGGSYTVTFTANPAGSQFEGYWLRVLAREGGEWKGTAASFTRKASPAPAVAAGTTAPQPTAGSSTPLATPASTK